MVTNNNMNAAVPEIYARLQRLEDLTKKVGCSSPKDLLNIPYKQSAQGSPSGLYRSRLEKEGNEENSEDPIISIRQEFEEISKKVQQKLKKLNKMNTQAITKKKSFSENLLKVKKSFSRLKTRIYIEQDQIMTKPDMFRFIREIEELRSVVRLIDQRIPTEEDYNSNIAQASCASCVIL